MNEKQYRQCVQNCSPRKLQPLFDGKAARYVLKAAARSVRRCQAARRVLDKNLTPTLSAGCEIGAGGHGTLELLARDALVFAELSRKRQWLETRLRRAVPGVRELIIRPAGWQPPDENESAERGMEALTE